MFIRFDSMEVTVSLARAVLLEYRDGSLCVMVRKEMGSGEYNSRPETTPKGMRKIGQQVEEDMGLKDPVFLLCQSWKRLNYVYTVKGEKRVKNTGNQRDYSWSDVL